MASVSGSIGGQPVVLDNAASEATLKAILAALQGQGAALGKMAAAGGSGGGAGGGVGGSAKGASSALNMLSKAAGTGGSGAAAVLGTMAKSITGIIGVAGTLISTVTEVAGAITALAKQAFDGEVRMSDFFDAFKDVPVIGTVMGLFGQLAKIQEANLDAYRQLTKTGIGFGGSLQEVRQRALDMGMSLDQMNAAMKSNADTFTTLGGTMDGGARAFSGLTKTLRDGKAGEQLMALGMNANEMADAMGNFIRVNAGLTDRQKKDYAGVAAAAAEYAKQTDILAKFTGESAAELEKKMQKEAADAAFEAQLLTMDEESRKKANEAMKVAMATGGQGAVDALKARMMGLPPMTEAGQAFVARMGSANKQLDVLESTIKDGSTADQSRQKILNAGADMQMDLAKNAKTQGLQSLQAQAAMGDETAKSQLKAMNLVEKAGVTTYEENRKRMGEAQKAQADQLKSEAAMAASAEKRLKDLGQLMQAFLEPILKVFQPLMTDIIKTFTDFINGPGGKDAMRKFGEAVASVVKQLIDWGKNILSKEGQDKMVNDIAYGFKMMMISLKRAVLPSWLYSEKDAEKDRDALRSEKENYDARAKLSQERLNMEGDLDAAALRLKKGGIEELKARTAKESEELATLSKKKQDDLTVEEKKRMDVLQQNIERDKALADKAAAMTDDQAKKYKEAGDKLTGQIKEYNQKMGVAVDEKGESKSMATRAEEAYQGVKQKFVDGTGGSGDVVRDFGSGTLAQLDGEEAVLNKQQLKNLINNAGKSGGAQQGSGQDALAGALNTLNKQTAQLIAINAQQAALQQRLVEKFEWQGNLFS